MVSLRFAKVQASRQPLLPPVKFLQAFGSEIACNTKRAQVKVEFLILHCIHYFKVPRWLLFRKALCKTLSWQQNKFTEWEALLAPPGKPGWLEMIEAAASTQLERGKTEPQLFPTVFSLTGSRKILYTHIPPRGISNMGWFSYETITLLFLSA